MLDVEKRAQKDRLSSLAQWAYSAIGEPQACVRVRLRGNNLHILCENSELLEAKTLVNRLLKALKAPKQGEAFPIDQSNPIYQLIIYGRTVGKDRPDWIKQIRLQPLQNTAANASQTSRQTSIDGSITTEELLISNESLARSGSPEAIARYLGETLSSLGVSVKVVVQELGPASTKSEPGTKEDSSVAQIAFNRRLWVVCNSNYSPDSSLLAEPVVEQLRNLQLKGFRDAAICSQVSGEEAPEWMLRVDLTPPEEMLKDWASWGDVQAIARTLNQELVETGIEVRAVLKDVTLHLFCNVLPGRGTAAPDKQTTVNAIAPLLDVIAPQGIQAATIYGVESHQRSRVPEQDTPIWIEWLNLPAAYDSELAESAFSLAKQGERDAITFLLERLINSDLDRRLATGGIHLKIRRKQDLLHIMSEAPVCPAELQVAPPIASLLRQFAIPEIAGVRIYGRRAGSTDPVWNYGVDFVHRRRLVPEATPEFSASDAYVDELVTPTGEPVLRKELTKEDLKDGINRAVEATTRILQRSLCYSQLFVANVENQELVPVTQSSRPKSLLASLGVRVAIVWGTVGLLLTLQTDWMIAQLLRSQANSQGMTTSEVSTKSLSLPQLSLKKSGTKAANDFNVSGFTKEGKDSVIVNEDNNSIKPKKANAAKAAMLASARSPNPTFNNQLLDEKLALYQQRFRESGPPDVLIIGSSRAMRGVDPQALKEALAAQGYPDLTVFNIGINGATAQVVDLIIRRILTLEQLPKLIIWADGARAFNKGRMDATYNAIATSEGYQRIKAGTFPNQANGNQRNRSLGETGGSNSEANPIAQSLAALSGSSQSVNNWLNDSVAKVSSTYPERDQLKSMLREQFIEFLKQTNFPQDQTLTDAEKLTNQESIDVDGFLPLSVRFNPATYYKQYSKVTGDYDGDYQSFQLGGEQDTALDSLLQFSKANKINLIFVNLPLTQEYLDPVRTDNEEKFQRYMRSSALERGLVFRDLSQLLLNKHDYFSDPSHLNRYGAYQVSNKLAQDPIISWPTKKKKTSK